MELIVCHCPRFVAEGRRLDAVTQTCVDKTLLTSHGKHRQIQFITKYQRKRIEMLSNDPAPQHNTLE